MKLLYPLPVALLLACAACGPYNAQGNDATAEPTAAETAATTTAIARATDTPTPAATRTATAGVPSPPSETATAGASSPSPETATAALPRRTPTPTPDAAMLRAREDFDAFPAPPWYHNGADGTSAMIAGGILTIDAPSGAQEFLDQRDDTVPPRENDGWNTNVSNARGWWVEVRMQVSPIVDDQCDSDVRRGPSLTLWATDDTERLVRLGFSRSCVALVLDYHTAIRVPMDTTSRFHIYRISTLGSHVDVYIDGQLAIAHDYPPGGEQTFTGLVFGDGQSGPGATRSYWDYLAYDVSGPSAP